jgi:hypothetical protein
MPAQCQQKRQFSAGIFGFRESADGNVTKARQGAEDFRRKPCVRQGAVPLVTEMPSQAASDSRE